VHGRRKADFVARQRITRKELLRQPDQFITRSARVIAWAESNAASILYGVGAVILAVVLVGGWFVWRANRHARAEALLYEAMEVVQQDASQNDQMVKALQSLVRDYGGTPAAIQGYWNLGRLYFARAEYMAALEAYEQARSRLSGDGQTTLMDAMISLNMAYAEEAQGACEQALRNFETVLKAPAATWLRSEAYLGMGRCHEQSGVPGKAAEVYDRALTDPEVNGPARELLEERLTNVRPAGDSD
jgi:predicted negative regulator of RcsB-dependent stress response